MKLSDLYEDYHGGMASGNGNYSTHALEKSKSVKSPLDRFNHPKKKKLND